jgi:hypothetical protein
MERISLPCPFMRLVFQIVLFSMLCLRDNYYNAASSRLLDFKTDTGKSYMEFWDGFFCWTKIVHKKKYTVHGILLDH